MPCDGRHVPRPSTRGGELRQPPTAPATAALSSSATVRGCSSTQRYLRAGEASSVSLLSWAVLGRVTNRLLGWVGVHWTAHVQLWESPFKLHRQEPPAPVTDEGIELGIGATCLSLLDISMTAAVQGVRSVTPIPRLPQVVASPSACRSRRRFMRQSQYKSEVGGTLVVFTFSAAPSPLNLRRPPSSFLPNPTQPLADDEAPLPLSCSGCAVRRWLVRAESWPLWLLRAGLRGPPVRLAAAVVPD